MPTNGKYAVEGPKPYGLAKRLLLALKERKDRKAK